MRTTIHYYNYLRWIIVLDFTIVTTRKHRIYLFAVIGPIYPINMPYLKIRHGLPIYEYHKTLIGMLGNFVWFRYFNKTT